jgi:Lon protease-like protein
MMDEVLKGDQSICMALLKPGWESDYYGSPAVHPIACVGKIVQHQILSDGRYNLTLHGEYKVAIEGFERVHPFRIARVRRLAENDDWTQDDTSRAMAQELLQMFQRFHEGQEAAIDLAQLFGAHMGSDAILNTIAMHLKAEPALKQHLLEMESVGLRYAAVRQILSEATSLQDLLDRARHLAPPDRRMN